MRVVCLCVKPPQLVIINCAHHSSARLAETGKKFSEWLLLAETIARFDVITVNVSVYHVAC